MTFLIVLIASLVSVGVEVVTDIKESNEPEKIVMSKNAPISIPNEFKNPGAGKF